MLIVVHMQGQADLFQVVCTLSAPRRFTRRLHRRQQQRDQNADDRDDHKQLNERKASRSRCPHHLGLQVKSKTLKRIKPSTQ
jgi:hypothetical protein